MISTQQAKFAVWSATALAVVAPFLYWADFLNWQFSSLGALQLFPLFGLWAFSLMWAHYAVSVYKRHTAPEVYDFTPWYKRTSNIVLILILLHPALLIFKMAQNDLTPFDYIAEENTLFLLFGYLALLVFLLWEVAEKLKEKAIIKNNKPLIGALNNAAFVAIYFHGLTLGQHLQTGFLRGLWIFYGITMVFIFAHNYYYDLKSK